VRVPERDQEVALQAVLTTVKTSSKPDTISLATATKSLETVMRSSRVAPVNEVTKHLAADIALKSTQINLETSLRAALIDQNRNVALRANKVDRSKSTKRPLIRTVRVSDF